MSLASVTALAVGLAMDAFAASIAAGSGYKNSRRGHIFQLALACALFQAFMPLIGWAAGLAIRDFVRHIDHWVAFGLLCFVGTKMIIEAFEMKEIEAAAQTLGIKITLMLALATSIDALAVGVTFSFLLPAGLIRALIIIGAVTFVLVYAGFYIGRRFGHFFESKIEALGGIVLIIIGLKILIQGLFFSAAA